MGLIDLHLQAGFTVGRPASGPGRDICRLDTGPGRLGSLTPPDSSAFQAAHLNWIATRAAAPPPPDFRAPLTPSSDYRDATDLSLNSSQPRVLPAYQGATSSNTNSKHGAQPLDARIRMPRTSTVLLHRRGLEEEGSIRIQGAGARRRKNRNRPNAR